MPPPSMERITIYLAPCAADNSVAAAAPNMKTSRFRLRELLLGEFRQMFELGDLASLQSMCSWRH